MSSGNQPEPGSAADAQVVFTRAPSSGRYEALSLLLTGAVRDADPMVDQFLDYVTTQSLSLDQLWLAQREGRPVAAALLVPCPGRTAMVFISPTRQADAASAAACLVQTVCQAQKPDQIRLFQALLEPTQDWAVPILEKAGFAQLATLLYLEHTLDPAGEGAALTLRDDVEVLPWSEARRDLFGRTILASYENTLDCPALRGLRTLDDVLESHMAAGKFVPALWCLLHRRNEPVGVMLLNHLPQRAALELVYLGLAPAWRGRGLARMLLRHGFFLAPRYDARVMLCAVDQKNTPALRLYRGLGFVTTARRLAMIHSSATTTE